MKNPRTKKKTEHFYPEGVVEDTLSSIGVEVLSQNGDELVALCPGHKDRTGKEDEHPSWSINGETGVHFCFSCQYRGNLFTLVRDLRGEDAASGLQSSLDLHGGRLVLEGMEDLSPEVFDVPTPTAEDVRTANFHPESWLDPFTDPPLWALRARGITAAAAKEFEVRWDGEKEAWILPFRDPDTNRLLGYQLKSQTTRLFRNHPRDVRKAHTLFGWPALVPSPNLVVVESPLDAVLLSDYEVPAVAICGSHVSAEQEALLAREDWTTVFFWLDNDTAGRLETAHMRKASIQSGIRAEYITPDEFPNWDKGWKDPGDMPGEFLEEILNASGL